LKLALALRITRYDAGMPAPHVHHYVGIDAVALPACDEEQDPHTGAVLQPADQSGAQQLILSLARAYYLDDQDVAWTSLDKFFNCRQGEHQDFSTYVLEWQRMFDEAADNAHLTLSDVGKTYLFFSKSNLSESQIADLRLKVNGDLSRFGDMLRLQNRISKNEEATKDQRRGYRDYHEASCDDDTEWHADPWNSHDDAWWQSDVWDWQPDSYDDDSEYWQDSQQWYDDDEYGSYEQPYDEENYKGEKSFGKGKKGKGKKGKQPTGGQCTTCGSKFHDTSSCPLKDRQYAPTKGDEKGAPTTLHGEQAAPPEQEPDYYDWDPEWEWWLKRKGKGKGGGKGGKSSGIFPKDFSRGGKGGFRHKGKGKRFKGKKGKGKAHFGDAYITLFSKEGRQEPVEEPSGYLALPEASSSSGSRCDARNLLFGGEAVNQPRQASSSASTSAVLPLTKPAGVAADTTVTNISTLFAPMELPPEEQLDDKTFDVDIPNAPPSFLFGAHDLLTEDTPCWTFMTVGGRFRPGLLVDPGASKGLIGIDTLNEIIQYVLKPVHMEYLVKWTHSKSTFAGISSKPQQSLGQVRFPIGLVGLHNTSFSGDVLGESGAGCPGLIPLRTLIMLGCIILFAYYPNRDGLLGIRHPKNGRWCVQHLYLTDSGHYLLRVDLFNVSSDHHLTDQLEKEAADITRHVPRERRALTGGTAGLVFETAASTSWKDFQ